MSYINKLITTHWTTDYMLDKKKSAYLLVEFNKKKFLSGIKKEFLKDNKEINITSFFNELHELSSFIDEIQSEKLTEKDKKIINSINGTITYIDETYNHAFENYVLAIKNDIEDGNAGIKGIQKAKDYLSKHRKINHVDSSIKDLVSSISCFKYKKRDKAYDFDLRDIKRQYQDIKSMISDLKKIEYMCDQDIENLAEKEKSLNSNMEELISYSSKKPKNKTLKIFAGLIAVTAMLLSVIEIGKFTYENKVDIKNLFKKDDIVNVSGSIDDKVDKVDNTEDILLDTENNIVNNNYDSLSFSPSNKKAIFYNDDLDSGFKYKVQN